MDWDSIRQRASLILSGGVSLGSLPALLAESYGEGIALLAEFDDAGRRCGCPRSYQELEYQVGRYAAAFDAMGFHQGRRVLVSVSNRFELLLYIFALIRAGAIAVPTNPRLKPLEFSHIVQVTEASGALVDGEIAVRFGQAPELPDRFRWLWSGEGGSPEGGLWDSLARWLEQHPSSRLLPTQRRAPEESSVLLCTSGTTGFPKAAALTSQGLLKGAGLLLAAPLGQSALHEEGGLKLLSALPITHVMGLSVQLAGLCAGVPMLHCHRFRPGRVLELLAQHRVNAFVGVPTMYADLEAQGASRESCKSVQLWVSGADIMPPDRARRFQQMGSAVQLGPMAMGSAAFADVYGMVELSGPMAIRLYPPSLSQKLQLPAACITLPGFETRVLDGDGELLGWGKPGELQVRGPGVLKRYEGNPDASPDDEGWFSTGDFATLWPGGFFTFAGRQRDRLKVGGFSVFPAEVETILRAHPQLQDLVVVGLPDERLGERPVVLVIPEKQGFDTLAFLEWAQTQVAGYRRPREAFVVDALPRGNHGKINRAEATQMALQLAGL